MTAVNQEPGSNSNSSPSSSSSPSPNPASASADAPAGTTSDDPTLALREALIDAMQSELTRSMSGLQLSGSPRPYYLGYSLRYADSLVIRASYGSLLRSRQARGGRLYIDLRVGGRQFDNVMDGGLDVQAEDRESGDWTDAPDDCDPEALRVAFWKLTQIKFDEALQDYYDHRKAQVSEFLRDEIDSFSVERPTRFDQPFDSRPFPRKDWERTLAELSKRFSDHPNVYDPSLTLNVERVRRWMVTSEGTKVITEEFYADFSIEGWILNSEGVYVESTRNRYARRLADVPNTEEMSALLDEILADLADLEGAGSLGSFVGPALLSGQAASTMFHEALGHRLEGERLVARGETRTFARKLGESILPEGLDVYDDPKKTDHSGRPMWGCYAIDDEGMPAARAALVANGKLTGFLCSRTPTVGSKHSNGHGRSDGLQPTMARMGNLIVEARAGADVAEDRAALEARLIEVAKAQGNDRALIIERIRSGETSTNSYDFQVFKGELAEVYVLDVQTGVKQRVQDIELIGTPLSALQRIVAFGGDLGIDHGYCYAESGSVPVGGASPAIVLSEVELQQRSTAGFHEPLLPPPFADDGSRGRESDGRSRGRRKPARS